MPDRLRERRELKHLLVESGKSVLMLAPRRIGKTWTMLRLEEDADNEPFEAVLYDAEQATSKKGFYEQLNRKIETKFPIGKSVLTNLLARLKGIISRDHSHGDYRRALGELPADRLLEAYLEQLNKRPHPVVIMIDEIAVFALRLHKQEAGQLEIFLSELRALRQGYPNVRWLLTGSIGLDWVARSAAVEGTLNDLKPYSFRPFSRDAARTFIEQFVVEGGTLHPFFLDNDAFDYLVVELGWLSPYYLEALASAICPTSSADNGPKRANKDDVRAAFAALLEHQNRSYFSSWKEHISKNFEQPLTDRLNALLDACARTAEGEELDTLLAIAATIEPAISPREVTATLDILVGDGYLAEDSQRYRFASGLLRQWWARWMSGGGR